jgi:autotransporter-associated beta strand protein
MLLPWSLKSARGAPWLIRNNRTECRRRASLFRQPTLEVLESRLTPASASLSLPTAGFSGHGGGGVVMDVPVNSSDLSSGLSAASIVVSYPIGVFAFPQDINLATAYVNLGSIPLSLGGANSWDVSASSSADGFLFIYLSARPGQAFAGSIAAGSLLTINFPVGQFNTSSPTDETITILPDYGSVVQTQIVGVDTPSTPPLDHGSYTLSPAPPYTGTVTITPGTPVDITTTSLRGAALSTFYNETIAATGGTGPLTFTTTDGTLPPGLTLSSAGVLSGKPTTAGTYWFRVAVTDVGGDTANYPYLVTMFAGAYVDPSFTGSGDPATDPGLGLTVGVTAFSTISDALAHLSDGDTLVIFGGTYDEPAINIDKALSVIDIATNPSDSPVIPTVTITSPVTLTDNAVFGLVRDTNTTNSQDGSLVFDSTVDGPGGIWAWGNGPLTFNAPVGGNTALSYLNIDPLHQTIFGSSANLVKTVGDQTYFSSVEISAPATTFYVGGTKSMFFEGIDGGATNAVIKDGPGTLTIDNPYGTGSTYGGLTSVNAGTLYLNAKGAQGTRAINGDLQINTAGSVIDEQSGQFAATSSVTIAGSGSLTLNAGVSETISMLISSSSDSSLLVNSGSNLTISDGVAADFAGHISGAGTVTWEGTNGGSSAPPAANPPRATGGTTKSPPTPPPSGSPTAGSLNTRSSPIGAALEGADQTPAQPPSESTKRALQRLNNAAAAVVSFTLPPAPIQAQESPQPPRPPASPGTFTAQTPFFVAPPSSLKPVTPPLQIAPPKVSPFIAPALAFIDTVASKPVPAVGLFAGPGVDNLATAAGDLGLSAVWHDFPWADPLAWMTIFSEGTDATAGRNAPLHVVFERTDTNVDDTEEEFALAEDAGTEDSQE